MPIKNTQEAVISNDALASDLESKLDSVTSETRNILEETIFRIKNIGKYVSEFLKRGTTLIIGPAPELVINEANIRQSLEKVIQREKSRGNKMDVSVDNDIWSWGVLKGRTMTAIEKQFNATIYLFTQKVAHAKIREEAGKLMVKKDWNISEAWNIIIAGILAGEVDTNGTGISAYFTVKVQGVDVFYRFFTSRPGDGKLRIVVFEVRQGFGWPVGDGVVLSN